MRGFGTQIFEVPTYDVLVLSLVVRVCVCVCVLSFFVHMQCLVGQ